MYTIDWKRISNGGNFVVLEVADINMVKKKKCSFHIIFSPLQALPIFLDKLVPPWAAILISVTLILAFGEVVYHQYGSKLFYKKILKLLPILLQKAHKLM